MGRSVKRNLCLKKDSVDIPGILALRWLVPLLVPLAGAGGAPAKGMQGVLVE